jgi:uncharacterized protein (DUF2141 family)
MVLLSFAGALTSWQINVVRADNQQAAQSLSISGLGSAISGEAVQYQIQYNDVIVDSDGVRYAPPAGTIDGKVFNDLNGNGVPDLGEYGIAGVEILLSNGEQYTTTTDANGNYQFGHLLPGIYTVVEFDPAGFVSTTSNAQAVIVSDGGSAIANFGDQRLGTVSGTVFDDFNGDGEQDDGEAGISNVTMTLANE